MLGRISEGKAQRIALVAATAADVRDTVVEGQSGILACSPPWYEPKYEPSKRRLTWPRLRTKGGSLGPEVRATTFSADEPDRLRGPQHDTALADELAAWFYDEAWAQLMFGLRLGDDPRVCVATTPRPTPIIRELLRDSSTVVTRGSTYDNRANLAPAFLTSIVKKYEGTRLGRQELHAEILDDAPGALWKRDQLDALRVASVPEFRTIVVAVDPAVTSGEDSDETGILVAGLGEDSHGYVLEDLSGKYTPDEWATKVVSAVDRWNADRVVVETNQGGDLAVNNVRTKRRALPVRKIHASRGKRLRAEPVAALYEQGRVHHKGGFAQLEDELCQWEPGVSPDSPNRLDAMVYALTELMVDHDPKPSKSSHVYTRSELEEQGIGL